MRELTLKIVTPQGEREPVTCDSVRLTVCDGAGGRGGGSYGIRPGHTRSLFSLKEGPVRAFLEGKEVFAAEYGGGFASVDRNIVTVVAEDVKR